MNRGPYALYVCLRLSEALAIASGAALLAHLLQGRGPGIPHWFPCAGPWSDRVLSGILTWAWPASCALAAHLVLGPKQKRPVYLRIPGAMYTYAGVTVDRNAGCRGGCTTGATGSGKTLACIMPRLHSLCINEAGIERPGWRPAARSAAPDGHRASDWQCVRASRYRVPPWGGFVCGEKGNEWESIEALLTHHGRRADLCLIRTRPSWASPEWTPTTRFNLLSMDAVPADTYAKILVDTGLCIEEAAAPDEFFIPQARDKIAWGIRLVRAVARAPGPSGAPVPPRPGPSLVTLLDLLTVQESYRRYLLRCSAENPCLAAWGAFTEARFQLENNYWNQPSDQLGGVRSTLYNFLVPFCEPEIAEVFCADSTFDLRDIELGKVVCLAIPQKYAVQRRYVATVLKTLVYQVVLQRFDRRRDEPGWTHRNVILVEQDEWQRHAVRADCEVDVVREAQGAVHAATQSQNAVWAKFGGRESAAAILANLRNRWICQAATEECAEESSRLAGRRVAREVSFSTGQSGRTTNVSFPERPFLPARELRSLPPFHVVFVPAEGRWLYRTCIAMPATPDGRIPHWWFGDWNPLRWASRIPLPRALRSLERGPGERALVPPWRAGAPLRAMARWLLGLDGTFIITGGMTARAAGRNVGAAEK